MKANGHHHHHHSRNGMLPSTAPYTRPSADLPQTIITSVPFFSEEELDMVMTGKTEIEAPEVSYQARALARTLGAQYVEVIAHYAIDALQGRTSRHAPKLRQIVRDSRRLATEMGDGELLALYGELSDLIETFGPSLAAEQRLATSRKLREWVMTFADLVGGEAGQKLRRVVVYRKGVHPLISHLRGLRGIGERRLEKLYAAGLLTADRLVDADPAELAHIVGIPLRLARQVVETCQRFIADQRLSHVKSLKNVVGEVTRTLRHVDPHDPAHVRLVASVRETINGLVEAITALEESWVRDPRA